MTDRKPGAPGQFKAVVTQEQLQKLQNGEQFVLTLTRDDQPITEGTPYSKAAVLPDELAATLCPNVLDPTPADALAALLPMNGNGEMTGALRMGNNKITGIGNPTGNGDALPKGYILPVAEGGTGATTATEALKNLGGRNTVIDLLWRNASWTSSFSAQNVSWESNVTYDAYIVTFTYDTSYGHEFSVFVNNHAVFQGRNGSMYYGKGSPTMGSEVLNSVNRNFSVNADGKGCSFATGYRNASGDNTACVPVSVYGIKW